MRRFVALEKIYRMGDTRKKAHFNFVEKIFEKDGKMSNFFVSTVVFLVLEGVDNSFLLLKIYSFVALEELYRMGWMTKNVYSNFEEKNVMENEGVLEPNHDIL